MRDDLRGNCSPGGGPRCKRNCNCGLGPPVRGGCSPHHRHNATETTVTKFPEDGYVEEADGVPTERQRVMLPYTRKDVLDRACARYHSHWIFLSN